MKRNKLFTAADKAGGNRMALHDLPYFSDSQEQLSVMREEQMEEFRMMDRRTLSGNFFSRSCRETAAYLK